MNEEGEINLDKNGQKKTIKNKSERTIGKKILHFIGKTFRVLGFFAGMVIHLFYFWNFFTILIGLTYLFAFKDPEWKRNGFVLAFTGALGSVLTTLFGGVSVIYSGILILGYVFFLLIKAIVLKFWKKGREGFKLISWWNSISKKIRLVIKLGVALIPIFMWSFFNLNFVVMFDNNPKLLWVNGSTTVGTGEEFDLVVEAWDQFERISANYIGTVEFSIKSYNLSDFSEIDVPVASLPLDYTFSGQLLSQGIIPAYYIKDGKDNGFHKFNMTISTPGIHYILVNDSFTGNTYWSNPIIVINNTNPAPKVVWGDIHTHSWLSDGSGAPENLYYYAKNIAQLEYYALTDHGEDLNVGGLGELGFNLYFTAESEANKAYIPGEFVTFPGVEWTTNYLTTFTINYGHYTCIFTGDKIPHIDSDVQRDPDALWNLISEFTSANGVKALALPHHTVRDDFIQDWAYLNSSFVRIAEVASVHGSSLFIPQHELNYMGSIDVPEEPVYGSSIIDALNMGYRLTLYASSDCHDGHPGHSLSHTQANIGHQAPYCIDYARTDHKYPGTLTAAFVDNLTRDSVFDALYGGRIYANSDFGRPFLNFTINEVPVSYNATVIVPTNTSNRNITVVIAQDGNPAAQRDTAASVYPGWIPNWNATIEIIKNGELWYNETISTPVYLLEISDNSLITGANYTDYIPGPDGKVYINEYSQKPVDPDTLNTGGADYYLIRIVGENGRISYSGPIWVQTP